MIKKSPQIYDSIIMVAIVSNVMITTLATSEFDELNSFPRFIIANCGCNGNSGGSVTGSHCKQCGSICNTYNSTTLALTSIRFEALTSF